MNRLRVVIVDDEPLARRGIRQLLAGSQTSRSRAKLETAKKAVDF